MLRLEAEPINLPSDPTAYFEEIADALDVGSVDHCGETEPTVPRAKSGYFSAPLERSIQ
jgi:hypothetical protein